MLAVFVVVLGFVTAAFIASISAVYQNSNGSIEMSLDTPFDALKGFLLCMFIGPYLILKNAANLWVKDQIRFSIFGLCIAITCVWSFCLGVVSIQTLVGLGVV